MIHHNPGRGRGTVAAWSGRRLFGACGGPFGAPLLTWPLRGHRRSGSPWRPRRRRRGAGSHVPQKEPPSPRAPAPTFRLRIEELAKHDRSVAGDQDAAFEVQSHGAGQDLAFELAAFLDEAVDVVAVADAADVLLDDGALVQVGGH